MANQIESKMDNDVKAPTKLIPAITNIRISASFTELKKCHNHCKATITVPRCFCLLACWFSIILSPEYVFLHYSSFYDIFITLKTRCISPFISCLEVISCAKIITSML